MDYTKKSHRGSGATPSGPLPDGELEKEPTTPSVSTGSDEPGALQPGSPIDVRSKARHLFNLYGGLLLGFLLFYVLADYTSFTTAEQRPGQLVISNTMVQLWTASYRMAFILGASMLLLRLFWPDLWRYFRPDVDGPDFSNTLRNDLTPPQRLCVFLAVFFALCLLFVLLLSVSLPETVSVGR